MAHRRAQLTEEEGDNGDMDSESSAGKEKPLSMVHLILSVILVVAFIVGDLAFYTNSLNHNSQMGLIADSGIEKTTISSGQAALTSSSNGNQFSAATVLKDRVRSSDGRGIVSNSNSNGAPELLPKGCQSSMPAEDYGPHRVPPPVGDVTLVCCESTKGILNIAVHPTWAPVGAENFLNMVKSKYFESRVPMMRALKGFLIQFGLSSLPTTQKEYEIKYLKGKGGLKDDKQWLPEGPPGRQSEEGVKRFKKGYLAYAGAGKNSRGTQLIVALEDNLYLGGGSPWEVPWGHLFGDESYATLASFYTGYVSAIPLSISYSTSIS